MKVEYQCIIIHADRVVVYSLHESLELLIKHVTEQRQIVSFTVVPIINSPVDVGAVLEKTPIIHED